MGDARSISNLNNNNLNSQDIDGEKYILVYPKKVEKDINRSISTLGFVDYELDKNMVDEEVSESLSKNRDKIDIIDRQIDELKNSYQDVVDNISYNKWFKDEASDYEASMAYGEKYFYFSALVNNDQVNKLEKLAKNYPDTRMNSESRDVKEKQKNYKNNNEKQNKTRSSEENYLLVYPQKVEKDVERSINTLGFVDNEIPDDIDIRNIDENYKQTIKELDEVNRQIEEINSSYGDLVENVSYSLDYSEKANRLKSNMAHGEDYFYMSGWVPESELSKFKDLERKYDKTIITSKDHESVNEEPPTRLRNNKAFRPFEYLVNMYGAPNYDEVDPTPFFAITYMLLYGLMFGDLGQGLVFLAIGFLVARKNKTFGALIKRIGISASFFGLMYGSFFGREDLIPALLIKPFDNVMTVLIASVAFGVSLMIISYIIGIYNKVHKQDNIEEGIFGKEGLAGLMMMVSFIIIVLNLVNKSPLPMPVGVVILVLSIIMMVFKQPIARKISDSKRLYDQSKSDYYIESSFSIIEALLSVFSNLVSFTRVGAFAINHVGLYMAFEVMANLAGGGFWGFIILLLGNILIIGLEGMIVFIQGLRLEFYEMFSKYYEGNGRLFRPINQKEIN